MKNNIIVAIMMLSCWSIAFSQEESVGKGFEKGNMYHSIGVGGQNYWRVGDSWGNGLGYLGGLGRLGNLGSNLTVQYQAEWGIHDYIGLGFHTGLTTGGFRYNYTRLYIPIGVQANFHFYQLIDDKVSSDIKSDKLDIYAGLNFGGGPVFRPETNDIFGGIHGGTQVGVRYYLSSNFGIFAELGYGKSYSQFGIVLR